MAPTLSELRTAVVTAINAGGFGVTAVPTWRGIRGPEALRLLKTLTVEVLVVDIENEPETATSAELNRDVAVLVRHNVGDPDDLAACDAVAELAESIGRFLLNNSLSVDASPQTLRMGPVIDPDVLTEHAIAEAAATVRYWSGGG